MANDPKTFLDEERERIELRLTQIRTVERPAVEAQLEALNQEYTTLKQMFETANGSRVAVAKSPEREAKRPKSIRKPPKARPKKPVVPEETVNRVWVGLRAMRTGATVKELATTMGLSESYVRYAFEQLVAEGRATMERRLRKIGKSERKVKIYTIVSPQREGSDAPPSRPRYPTPAEEATRTASRIPTPRRGTPVPGTGRGAVVLPNDKDTANIVLEAVKQGWHTEKDGKEHIRVIRDQVTDEATGEVTVKRAEVRVSSTPNAPSLDRIKKEFGEYGVVYNKR